MARMGFFMKGFLGFLNKTQSFLIVTEKGFFVFVTQTLATLMIGSSSYCSTCNVLPGTWQ
jgi:hypothetical protein